MRSRWDEHNMWTINATCAGERFLLELPPERRGHGGNPSQEVSAHEEGERSGKSYPLWTRTGAYETYAFRTSAAVHNS